MANYLSLNRKKIKASASISRLVAEYERDEKTAEKYDDGHRNIDVEKTKDNVVLKKAVDEIDKVRKSLIDNINHKRSLRSDGTQKTRALSRALRADTVDVLMNVVQPSAEFINSLDREQQVAFFSDALEVMKSDWRTYGTIISAVIHFDETTPHLQVITSTIDPRELRSRAKDMMGNKSQMSRLQTDYVDKVQAKGWNVERGIKRVDNKDYKNWKDEAEYQTGNKVNRFNEKSVKEYQDTKKQQDELKKVESEIAEQARKYFPEETEKSYMVHSSPKKSKTGQYLDYFKTFLSELSEIKEAIRSKMVELEELVRRNEKKEKKLAVRERVLEMRKNNIRDREVEVKKREVEVAKREDEVGVELEKEKNV